MAIFSSVLRAFRALFTRIYYWGPRPTVLEASVDVEKGVGITENQRRGMAHIHPFSVNSTVALNLSGIRDDHINSQPYISCDTPTSLYRDDLSDESFSSMPPLEWPGSTPSGSSDSLIIHRRLDPQYSGNICVPAWMFTVTNARLSPIDDVE